MVLSQYLGMKTELDDLGVFDPTIDSDSPFYINILLLRDSVTPEFQDSYNEINEHFRKIIKLLDHSKSKGDTFYKQALKLFNFHEVNELNLGLAKGATGAGFGEDTRRQVIDHGYDIVKEGIKDPELFQLMELFEDNVGPDRISDMVGTIILDDVKTYTLNVWKELDVNSVRFPNCKFDKAGYLLNPYKQNRRIYLVPTELLNTIPIAKEWDEISDVVEKNNIIRSHINHAVGEEWYKYSAQKKKEYLRLHVFGNPKNCAEVIEGYREAKISPFDVNGPDSTYNYLAERNFGKFLLDNQNQSYVDWGASKKDQDISSLTATLDIMKIFKEWVEIGKGWEVIQFMTGTRKTEKFVQRFIALAAGYYIEVNGLDISFEPDEGRGPVDLKISRGSDKTVTEVKLSSNQEYLHGYEEQVWDYAKAEHTDSAVYLLVDVGNPRIIQKMVNRYKEDMQYKVKAPHFVLIDAVGKPAASKYDAKTESARRDIFNIDFEEMYVFDT